MRINLYCIAKERKRSWESLWTENYRQMCLGLGGRLEIRYINHAEIFKAQKISPTQARIAYSKALKHYISSNARNIALHPNGRQLDTSGFKNLINKKVTNFFIAGSYGFEPDFLSSMDTISLSNLTMGHRIAQLVLCEQIYRALSMIHNHPYHK